MEPDSPSRCHLLELQTGQRGRLGILGEVEVGRGGDGERAARRPNRVVERFQKSQADLAASIACVIQFEDDVKSRGSPMGWPLSRPHSRLMGLLFSSTRSFVFSQIDARFLRPPMRRKGSSHGRPNPHQLSTILVHQSHGALAARSKASHGGIERREHITGFGTGCEGACRSSTLR